ncbi:restriction endonuclease subunit S [Lysinibacillus sp. NPDC097195]|uniref:restriction endonuclease subunit S n=1 Tax=Lysinibacillus sp. NPDC097195 TaxID=3364141 RepID=UPI00381D46A2
MLERYRLDEIALIVASLTTPHISYSSTRGQPFITAENLKWLALDGDIHQLPKINETVTAYAKCAKVPAKTIILAKNDVGDAKKYIFQCEQEMYIAHDVVAIIPNESIILSDYLYFFLQWYQPTKDWTQLRHIKLDIPTMEVQTNIVQLLKTSQLLLKNKHTLLTVVEELPQHIQNTAKQTAQHTNHLNHGFDRLQMFYHMALHKIFTGELYQIKR